MTPMQERLHMSGFVLATVALLIVLGFLGMLVWPYRDGLGTLVMVVIIVLAGCLCYEAVMWTRHRQRTRARELEKFEAEIARAWLHAKVVEAAGIAAFVNDNESIFHLSAMEENAKIFPVQTEELTGEIVDEVKRLQRDQGMSERAIAGRLNVSRTQVRKLLGKGTKE